MPGRSRVYRATTTRVGTAAARRLVEQVVYEIRFGANARLLTGPYTTGTLALSLESDIVTVPNSVRGSVGSRLPYARTVHDGAKVHEIFPKGAPRVFRFGEHRRPQLKFYWRKVGHTVYFPHIPGGPSTVGRSHPGQRGKQYLLEPLRGAARRHGMKIIITEV